MAGKRQDRVRTEFYDPQIMNRLEYAVNPTRNRVRLLEAFYISQLTQMCVARFKWENLPDDIDERFIEMALLHRGLVVFFKEDEIYDQYLAMRASGLGPINVYDNPTSYTVTGGSGEMAISKTLMEGECVPIWSNNLRTPEFPYVQLFANRLAELDRTIEIAIQNERQTRLIGVPQDQVHSANQIIKAMNEGNLQVFGNELVNDIARSIHTIDLSSHPSKVMNLLISKAKVWNEVMTMFGVNNSNQDKKERLVAAEVGANNEQIDLTKRMNLMARERACELINDMFDLNVSVEFVQSETSQLEGNQGVSANAVPKEVQDPNWGN